MKAWPETDLLEKIHIKHGYAFKGEYFVPEGKYMVLTPGNFFEDGGFRVRESKEKYYSGEIPEQYILNKGDLVVAMTEQGEGLLGSAAIIPNSDAYLHNQRLGLISVDTNKIDRLFLYYLFNTSIVRQQIRNSSSGTKVRHTSPERIYKVKVNLPTLDEQKKIAAILTAYDDLIENNKRRIALLEKMAEEIYREWFVRFRFPGYQSAEFEKGIPKGWDIDKAEKFFGHVKGKSYGSDEISDNPEQGKPFINLKSFYRGGGYREDGLKYYSGSYRDQQLVIEGDVVMAVTDMTQNREVVGRVARVPDLGEKGGVISLDVIKLVPKSISTTFLYSYMKYSGFGDFIKEFANGANVLHLKPDLVVRQEIVMPPEELRNQFDELADPMHAQVSALSKSIKILETTKNSLLPRLISGKLSVADLDIQFPPSMLDDEAA